MDKFKGVIPLKPRALWMLHQAAEPPWVMSVDDARGGESYLCCLSLADAKAAAEHQRDAYGVECIPVRVI